MSSEHKQDDIRVLVTGASGFIAGHIIIQLLQAGYRVRGTVRDSKRSQGVLDLAKLVPNARYPVIELAEAELTNEKGWSDAVRDCTYVMHTASPFIVETPKDENVLIKPAVEGTLIVLKAVAATHGQVKRVVLTSSIASIAYGHPKELYNTKTFNESDWTIANNCTPYTKSKTLAEKAAWDYLATLPAEDKFELTTINPGYVQGPVLNNKGCASQEVVQRLLTGKIPGIPALAYGVVDVRDVALAHLRAMITPEAASQRYLCAADTLWMMDFATTLKQEFPTYKVSTMSVPKFVLSIVQLWDSGVKSILPDVGKPLHLDNSKIQKELGLTFRSAKQTVIDMAYSLINLGIVPAKRPKSKLEMKQDEKQPTTSETTSTSTSAPTAASTSTPASDTTATTTTTETSAPATTTETSAATTTSPPAVASEPPSTVAS